MSPQAALQSPIFRAYFLIMLALLLAAGVILGVLRWGLKKQVDSIWTTYKSWLIMAPIGLGCVFAGRAPFIVVFCLIGAIGLQGIRPRHRSVSGLVDDGRGISRHRRRGGDLAGAPAAGGRARPWLVRAVCGAAGLHGGAHHADPHPAKPGEGAASETFAARLSGLSTSAGCSATWLSWPTRPMLTATCSICSSRRN